MKDIDIAKQKLIEDNKTFVAVKNGEVIFESSSKGVLPVFLAYTNKKLPVGVSVADKCIGKATAVILSDAKVSSVYTDLMSIPARFVLNKEKVELEYKKLVSHILNKDKNDLCPVERISIDKDNVVDIIDAIDDFLMSIGISTEME